MALEEMTNVGPGAGVAPKVSVVTITYNQARYIAQALESVLTQKTTFDFELLVGEDCSTDGTREIVEPHGESIPARRVFARPANVGAPSNFQQTLRQARGQYVALLEGDDYWTDPRKLQRQVDSLDAHPDWTISFHWVRVVSEDGSQPDVLFPSQRYDRVLTVYDLFRDNCIQTCSVMYRRVLDDYPAWLMANALGDWPLPMLHADRGDIGFLPEEMAVYRVHRQSTWSMTSKISRYRATLDMLAAVDRHFEGRYHRQISATRRRMSAVLFCRRCAEAVLRPFRRSAAGAAWLRTRFSSLHSKPERTPD